MYLNMIFQAIFIGYSVGAVPAVSYHYGAGTDGELHSLLKKSLRINAITAILMFTAAECLAGPLSKIFVGYDPGLFSLTKRAFFFYSFSFLFSGITIFGSSFFTALNNGMVSALVSFLRTLVFQVSMVIMLPLFLQVDGIWISIPIAEILSMIVTSAFLVRKQEKYGY